MSYTTVEIVQLTRIVCGRCGIPFMVPTTFYDECQKLGKGKVFYCPNGHGRVFSESVVDRLKKEKGELELSRFSLQNQLTEKNMIIDVLRKSIVRKDKRLKAGVCPCCNRTFKQLADHMRSKHPDYSGPLKPVKGIHKKINSKKRKVV